MMSLIDTVASQANFAPGLLTTLLCEDISVTQVEVTTPIQRRGINAEAAALGQNTKEEVRGSAP